MLLFLQKNFNGRLKNGKTEQGMAQCALPILIFLLHIRLPYHILRIIIIILRLPIHLTYHILRIILCHINLRLVHLSPNHDLGCIGGAIIYKLTIICSSLVLYTTQDRGQAHFTSPQHYTQRLHWLNTHYTCKGTSE